jgi:phosphoribosylformimino-5-aminoimidazole carboxamide ribotide isomerase
MELYPAIDVRGGAAVRLTQGDFGRETRYGDPLALAEMYLLGGARWIHVVDLEAARTGLTHESPILDQIVQEASRRRVQVQAGGGIRDEMMVESTLGRGVGRVVMGTAALRDPDLATRCARRWPEQVAVGLDYVVDEDGGTQAMGHGWREGSGRSLAELLARWEGEPMAAVVATSIARDGMLEGPDLGGMRSLLESTAIPIIASGGVGSLTDIEALAALSVDDRRLAGVIVGKALVENRFSVEEALAACAPSA